MSEYSDDVEFVLRQANFASLHNTHIAIDQGVPTLVPGETQMDRTPEK